jgi:hypothetical protein
MDKYEHTSAIQNKMSHAYARLRSNLYKQLQEAFSRH